MSRTSESLHERRAAQRRRLRRQRMVAGLVVLALVVAGAAIAAGLGGGTPPASNASAANPPVGHTTSSPANGQGAQAVPVVNTSAGGIEDARGIANIKQLSTLGLPIHCAGPHGNEVAFTFDDGPGPYTHYALKKLTDAGEQATFFVVRRSIRFFPGRLTRELKVAAIGDHTATHPYLPGLSPTAIKSEITSTKQKIEQQTGQPVYLFRPPYGAHNATVDRIVKRLGLLEILWSVDSADSLGADWAGIIHNVEAGLRPGAIILLHENRGQTIRALTTLLRELHRRHLRSVSLPELFASDPPSVAQVRKGPHGCGVKVSGRSGS